MSGVFLSYARKDDEPFVRRLYEGLTGEGFDVWFDRESMPSRQLTFYQEIADAIRERDRLVLVIGPRAKQSDYVRQEWIRAMELDKAVVPVLRIGGEQDVPEEVRFISYLDFRDDAKFAQQLSCLVQKLRDPAPPIGALFAVPSLPPHFLERPDRLRALKDAVMVDLRRPVVVSGPESRVMLQGMGGIGKSVLAAALARDREVRYAYPDGIVWVKVGREPKLERLQRDVAVILGDPGVIDSVPQGKARLKQLLLNKSVVLVLDDVWQPEALDAFDVLGPRSRAVITTRDAGICHSFRGVLHQVHLLSETEALKLLAASSNCEISQLPPQAHEVVKECGRLALAVDLCGGMVRRGSNWAEILEALRAAQLKEIADRHALNEDHVNLFRAIEVSVNDLPPAAVWRFAELCVFPPDQTTPEAAITTLWQHTGKLSKLECGNLLRELAERSLIRVDSERGDGPSTTRRISLHDLVFDFATHIGGDRAALHGQVLEAYRKMAGGGWWNGPDDGYFLNHTGYHLVGAKREEELARLLGDYRWLRARTRRSSVQSLLEDFELIKDSVDEGLKLLEEAIRLSAHVISHNPRELASQLTGRLTGLANSKAKWLVEQAVRDEPEPWLRPLTRSLTPPGGALLRTLEGHAATVTAVKVTGDGLRIISGSNDKTIKIWDMRSGVCLKTLAGHTRCITALAVSRDGRKLISGTDSESFKEAQVFLWDVESGTCLHQLTGHEGDIKCIGISPDDSTAVVAGGMGSVLIWDLRAGTCLRTFEPRNGVKPVAVTPDGTKVVCGSGYIIKPNENPLQVWDLERFTISRSVETHKHNITCASVSPDGLLAVSGSEDKTLRVWALRNGTCISKIEHGSEVSAVAVTSDGKRVVSAGRFSWDKSLRIWDCWTGECLATLKGVGADITALSLAPDDKHAVTGSDDGKIRVWRLDAKTGQKAQGHNYQINVVALTPDEKRIISAASETTLAIWDVRTGRMLRDLRGHEHSVDAVSITKDGRRLISGSYDHSLRVWSVKSGKCLKIMRGHDKDVTALDITPDGGKVISGSSDHSLCVWSLKQNPIRSLWKGLAQVVRGRFSSGSEKEKLVTQVPVASPIRRLQGHTGPITAVAALPDGRHAISASRDSTLRIWDINTGECTHLLKGHEKEVGFVRITEDGRRAVSGSDDYTLRVWDMTRGNCLRTLTGHTHSINALAITPDGTRAISGTSTVFKWMEDPRVWNLETGTCLGVLKGHRSSVGAVSISADGRYAITGCESRLIEVPDQRLRIWDLLSGECIGSFEMEGGTRTCTQTRDMGIIIAGDTLGRLHVLRREPGAREEAKS